MSTGSPGDVAAGGGGGGGAAAIHLERVPLGERAAGVLYVFLFGLMLTVLWAMAESRSIEAKAAQILPGDPWLAGIIQRPSRVAAGGGYAPTDRSTSSKVVRPSATSW